MKNTTLVFLSLISVLTACDKKVDEPDAAQNRRLYIDVHDLEPGKVTLQDVAGAHQKDLATQGKYGVSFIKYWVDEAKGKVYCLSQSPSDSAIYHTHQEAHGLVPDLIAQVSDGEEAPLHPQTPLYFDVHYLGAGNVTAKAVADAHVKDLAVQKKYKTSFINYWVDEKRGIVMCLAEAPDSASMVATHKEAHGLIPQEVHSVQQGN